MSLPLHLSIHVVLSLLAGLIVFKITKRPFISFFFALLSGVMVDADHFIDYFAAFGWNFNLNYFVNGYQFLKTDKIHILFHAWEYVIIAIVLAFFLKNKLVKATLISLALGLFFHLSTDCILNEGMKPQAYSIVYRIENNFDVEKLVTPEHYKKHLEQKESVKFE